MIRVQNQKKTDKNPLNRQHVILNLLLKNVRYIFLNKVKSLGYYLKLVGITIRKKKEKIRD
jgi:hypothetical protein